MEAFGDTGSFVPLDEAFIEGMLSRDEKESTRIQTANPWFTNHYNREREKLFYYSLQLTKEFVLSSRCCFRNFRNLALLWQETQDAIRVSVDQLVVQAFDQMMEAEQFSVGWDAGKGVGMM